MKRQAFTRQQAEAFRAHFGWSLVEFWCPFTGFDVIKFDTKLNVPDGISCKDYLVLKHPDSISLVTTLIKSI